MGPDTSRRALLSAIAITPAIAATSSAISPWQADLDILHRRFDNQPVKLVRSREGREMSLFRYQNAHSFFPDPRKPFYDQRDFLYFAGITAQLGLSAHLLDVGFPDDWCARHIGLRVANALAYANATGFGHDSPRMLRLARVLTPYWKWNPAKLRDRRQPSSWGFEPEEVTALLGAMLRQVRHVTGHLPDRDMLLREDGCE